MHLSFGFLSLHFQNITCIFNTLIKAEKNPDFFLADPKSIPYSLVCKNLSS